MASPELNRLLCAALISQKFCDLLLSDPLSALAAGCLGERFCLTPEELVWLCSLKADSVVELARCIVERDAGCQAAG